jgi:N-dimethylarginine dimethylaminohydrolase
MSDITLPRTVPDAARRRARTCTFVMCAPTFFEVAYSINPWMDPGIPTSADIAFAQWDALRLTLAELGHRVGVLDPLPGQPDMVFAANGAVVVGDRGVTARFRYPQRAAEELAHHEWLVRSGIDVVRSTHTCEGEGDLLVVPGSVPGNGTVYAGYGYRTDRAAHAEVAAHLGVDVVPLELVDPRFYHLDTALSVLDADTAIYFPGAFTDEGLARIHDGFAQAVAVSEADALVLGVNAISDGLNVVLEEEARDLCDQLADLGFVPRPVAMSELRKSGGAARCCVLELF